ncbi:MAG: hypothetical protein AUI16_03640 [Alphaproteobacteria bacterium 13_2_20CM_2_64_7]|nr:MAG: hypothetical protein AUI16_03640 [Alphaproteobacteria bacterium 13_2_20CM_2_64_7]
MDKLIHWIVTAAGGAVLTWITRYHDPWYSDGWFLNNLQWLLVPAVVALAAAIASLFARGLIAVIVLAVIAAAAFGVLYGQSNQNEQWPLVTWLLHLVVFCAARRHRRRFCPTRLCLVARFIAAGISTFAAISTFAGTGWRHRSLKFRGRAARMRPSGPRGSRPQCSTRREVD